MRRRNIGRALVVAGAVAIALATLTPSGQPPTPESFCVVCGELGGVDILLNVLLFAPLGAGLALLGARWMRAIPLMCGASALIELLQLTVISGRDASIGDVITNTLGGLLGFVIGAAASAIALPTAVAAGGMAVVWLAGWMMVQGIASYALQPSPTNSVYFGQLARALGDAPAYPGHVLVATVARYAIPDRDMPNSAALAQALRARGAKAIEVIVASEASPPTATSILRIADADEAEILMVGRVGSDATFGVRTHANDLRLRPPYFRFPNAFAPGARLPDTTRLRINQTASAVALAFQHAGDERTARIRLSPSTGWRLIMPWNVDFESSASGAVLDTLWLLLTVLPAGYWLAFAARGRGKGIRVMAALGVVVMLIAAGELFGAVIFEMAPPAWWEIVGIVVGITSGATVGRMVMRANVRERTTLN